MCHQHDQPPALAGHRQLGERLELFHLADESPGAVYWHPKGMAVVDSLPALCRELNAEQEQDTDRAGEQPGKEQLFAGRILGARQDQQGGDEEDGG